MKCSWEQLLKPFCFCFDTWASTSVGFGDAAVRVGARISRAATVKDERARGRRSQMKHVGVSVCVSGENEFIGNVFATPRAASVCSETDQSAFRDVLLELLQLF